MKRLTLALVLGLAAFTLATAFSPRGNVAHAEISGPCEATVNGIDVRPLSSSSKSDAIKVGKDDKLTIVFTTTGGGFSSHKVDLKIAWFSFNVAEQPDGGDQTFTDIENVDDYATYGVGLYKAEGSATLLDGTTCSGAVLFQIKGSPFGTVAGLSATVALLLGLLLLIVGCLLMLGRFNRIGKRVEQWSTDQLVRIRAGGTIDTAELAASLRAITGKPPIFAIWMIATLPLSLLMVGSSIGGGVPNMIRGVGDILDLPRIPWRPRISGISSIGGMLATEAALILFQQFAVTPLTASNTIVGLAVGLVMAIAVTSFMRWWGGRGVNRKIADTEKRLNDAIAQIRSEAGLPPVPPTLPGAPGPAIP